MNCPHCTNGTWDGPKLVNYFNGTSRYAWPCRDVPVPTSDPLDQAFLYRCTLCGFNRYERTVMDGGPIPDVAKPAKPAKDD